MVLFGAECTLVDRQLMLVDAFDLETGRSEHETAGANDAHRFFVEGSAIGDELDIDAHGRTFSPREWKRPRASPPRTSRTTPEEKRLDRVRVFMSQLLS